MSSVSNIVFSDWTAQASAPPMNLSPLTPGQKNLVEQCRQLDRDSGPQDEIADDFGAPHGDSLYPTYEYSNMDTSIPDDFVQMHNRLQPWVYPGSSNIGDMALSALSMIGDIFSTIAPIFYPKRPFIEINTGNSCYHPHHRPRNNHNDDSEEMTTGEAVATGGAGAAGVLAGAHFVGQYQSQMEEAQEGIDALLQTEGVSQNANAFRLNLYNIYSNFVDAAKAKRNLTFAGIVTTAGLVIGAAKKSWKVTKFSGIATLALMGVGLYCARPRGVFDAAGKSRVAFEANKRLLGR